MPRVHVVTQTALRRTTFLDPGREVQENTTHDMKGLRDVHPNETHKRRMTKDLEVRGDLWDTEIPPKDMGDVIVSTGL